MPMPKPKTRSMTKRVSINAPIPVRNIKPVIHGTIPDIILSTGDILKCLCKRATVKEILPNGDTVKLTFANYYTDNGAGLDARATAKVEHVVEEEHVVEPTVEEIKEEVPYDTKIDKEPTVETSEVAVEELINTEEEIPAVEEISESVAGETDNVEKTTPEEDTQPPKPKKKRSSNSKKKTSAEEPVETSDDPQE